MSGPQRALRGGANGPSSHKPHRNVGLEFSPPVTKFIVNAKEVLNSKQLLTGFINPKTKFSSELKPVGENIR